MLVLALLFVALAIADLVRVSDEINDASSWNKRVFTCRDRIIKAVPLTAIKIVLVSWQIVTQVRKTNINALYLACSCVKGARVVKYE